MQKRALIVVDMQNDFITGGLGTPQARAIVPYVVEKIARRRADGWDVLLTQDTHPTHYLQTREGKALPVEHCVDGTPGWEICPEVRAACGDARCFEKGAFGSLTLAQHARQAGYTHVELVGVCTDICVISNALLLRSALSEAQIGVDAAGCAGVTPQQHETALAAMRACQIDIV
ncbi:MAG: cysteine hydrolase [Eubacteriales bacterium]|nr:cysteine hydrolase [Eubacteriales bacterium]